jgi:hypothetical protein
VSQQSRSTFVLVHPSEIFAALVGLKDVRVVHYERRGPDVELMIEQVTRGVRCPGCEGPAQFKERPVVHYVDLPVYGTPMSLAWKKASDALCGPKVCETDLDDRGPPHRRQELPPHDAGGQVGDQIGGRGPHGLRGGGRTGL